MKKKKKRPPRRSSGAVPSRTRPLTKEQFNKLIAYLAELKKMRDQYGTGLPLGVEHLNSLLGTNFESYEALVENYNNVKTKIIEFKCGKFHFTIFKTSSKPSKRPSGSGRGKKWLYGICTAVLSSGIITWVIDRFFLDIF